MDNLNVYDQVVIVNVKGNSFIYDVTLYNTHKKERDAFFIGLTEYMNKEFKVTFTVDQVKSRWKRLRDDYTKGLRRLSEKKKLFGRLKHVREACFDFLEEHLKVNTESKSQSANVEDGLVVGTKERPANSSCSSEGKPVNGTQLVNSSAIDTNSGQSVQQEEIRKFQQVCTTSEQVNESSFNQENEAISAALDQSYNEPETSQTQSVVAGKETKKLSQNQQQQQDKQQQQPEEQPTPTAHPTFQFQKFASSTYPQDPSSFSQPAPQATAPVQDSSGFLFQMPKQKQKSRSSRVNEDDDLSEEESEYETDASDSDFSQVGTQRSQKYRYPKKTAKEKHMSNDFSDITSVLDQLTDCINKNKSHNKVRARATLLCKFFDELNPSKQIKGIRIAMNVFKKYELKKKRLDESNVVNMTSS